MFAGGEATGPPGEIGGVDPPSGGVGGVDPPPGTGVPDRGSFGLAGLPVAGGMWVRPVRRVLVPTADSPNGATDSCRPVCAVTFEWLAPTSGITSVLPLDAPGNRGNRTFGAGSTHWKA